MKLIPNTKNSHRTERLNDEISTKFKHRRQSICTTSSLCTDEQRKIRNVQRYPYITEGLRTFLGDCMRLESSRANGSFQPTHQPISVYSTRNTGSEYRLQWRTCSPSWQRVAKTFSNDRHLRSPGSACVWFMGSDPLHLIYMELLWVGPRRLLDTHGSSCARCFTTYERPRGVV